MPMEKLPIEFYKKALNLIQNSTENQSQLSSSVRSLLKNQFFKDDQVQFSYDGKAYSGKVVSVFRETSPSNKENPLKYNVETAESVFEAIPINKLKRETQIEDGEPFTFITKVAKKPVSEGPWVIREEYAEKYSIKEDKLHPFFSNMNSSKTSSNGTASTSTAKKENGAGPSKRRTIESDSSSSDDDTPINAVRKSGAGIAPSSAAAKKMAKKAPAPKKLKSPKKKDEKAKKSPSKKQPKASTKKADKSPSKTTKNGKTSGKKKQTNLSEFLKQGGASQESTSKSPTLTYEERMEKRAVNLNKQIIKDIVSMNVADLSKTLDAAAKNFPVSFVDKMPNEFARYCYNKALLKHEQKGKSAEDKQKIRDEKKGLQAVNEFSYLHRKLFAGKFEDSWITNSFELPEFTVIDQDPELLFKCIRLSAFLQSYRQVLDVRKNPTLFELMSSLDNGEDGFWRCTGGILTTITDFIRKNQRTIPHFNSGYLNYNIRHITLKTVHHVARKILNPDYNPNAVSDESDGESEANSAASSRATSPMEVDGQEEKKQNGTKNDTADDDEEEQSDWEEEDSEARINQEQTREDDELCERFCHYQIYELKPLEQARIFELLIQRVEASGPVRNSMKNMDAEVKKLKDSIATKEKKMEKLNKDLEQLPPLIPEEDYCQYSRAMTIGIVKKNRERKVFEEKKEELESEITEIRDAIEEMRGMSRFRAVPLGYDRFWRRYWLLPPTAGILIEQGAWTTETPDESQPLALPAKPKFANNEATDEQLLKFMHTLIGGGFPSTCAPVKWFHVSSNAELDRLYNCLNANGVRESVLKTEIQKARAFIEASFSRTN